MARSGRTLRGGLAFTCSQRSCSRVPRPGLRDAADAGLLPPALAGGRRYSAKTDPRRVPGIVGMERRAADGVSGEPHRGRRATAGRIRWRAPRLYGRHQAAPASVRGNDEVVRCDRLDHRIDVRPSHLSLPRPRGGARANRTPAPRKRSTTACLPCSSATRSAGDRRSFTR